MSFDHRQQVKNILTPITVTKDDDFALASIIIMYRGGPENLKPLFYVNDYDVVVTIDRPRTRESGPTRRLEEGLPLRYNADVPVYVCAVDKSDVTAARLLNKMRLAINSRVETVGQYPTFTLIVESGDQVNTPMGGYDPLWMDRYIFSYRPLES